MVVAYSFSTFGATHRDDFERTHSAGDYCDAITSPVARIIWLHGSRTIH